MLSGLSRRRLEMRAVRCGEQDVATIETDHLVSTADECLGPVCWLPRGLHRDGDAVELVEQLTALLGSLFRQAQFFLSALTLGDIADKALEPQNAAVLGPPCG